MEKMPDNGLVTQAPLAGVTVKFFFTVRHISRGTSILQKRRGDWIPFHPYLNAISRQGTRNCCWLADVAQIGRSILVAATGTGVSQSAMDG